MGIFRRKNYTEIGKTAAVEQFSQAFQKASNRKKRKLIEGAVKAFREQRPENIQALLSSSQGIDSDVAISMLRELSEGSDDKSAAIDRAFENANEGRKKSFLTGALEYVINSRKPAEESFVADLLKSGANANAEVDGFGRAGSLLALAVYNDHSPAVRQLLLANGASAEGALRWARANGYNRCYKTLEGYLVKTADKPAVADADTRELILQVREDLTGQIADLADEVRSLRPRLAAQDATQPEETTAPATGTRLRKVNKGP